MGDFSFASGRLVVENLFKAYGLSYRVVVGKNTRYCCPEKLNCTEI